MDTMAQQALFPLAWKMNRRRTNAEDKEDFL